MSLIAVRRALLSVSDKAGLVELARGLARHGVALASTGGTYRALSETGIEVQEISALTGYPEMLDGRVKTLHPKVHGGILHRRDSAEHLQTIAAHGIEPIDLVVVNLYPFEETVASGTASLEEAAEQIDIGGPSMIRSAAKNHAGVAVLTSPSQYAGFLADLDANDGKVSEKLRRELAVAAFARTAAYDAAIHRYLQQAVGGADAEGRFPANLTLEFERAASLRYGENPHQQAALYVDRSFPAASAVAAKQLHGKELSYNNYLDLDAALGMARDFQRPAAIVIKHTNPCGAAVADRLADAFRKAHDCDPISAFGSIIGFNRQVDEETAMAVTEPGRFVEAIIAPGFSEAAFEILTTRPSWKKNVRLLDAGDLARGAEQRAVALTNRPLEGGLLSQAADLGPDGFGESRVVTDREPDEAQRRDLRFAWAMVKHVRSNAIVLAKDEALVGVGAGQMSRVDAVDIAVRKAGDRAAGASLASDAFFPFRDNVDQAARAGVAAIVQPGGSKRDRESIDACNEHGIAMLYTGRRHFKH